MQRTWFELDHKCIDSHTMTVGIIDLAKNRGISPDKLTRGTGIFYQDLQKQRLMISSKQFFGLIAHCEKNFSRGELSFLIGRRLLQGNHELYSLLMNSRSLSDMFRMMTCFSHQLFPFYFTERYEHDERTYYVLRPSVCIQNTRFLVESLMTAVNAACKLRFGHQVPMHFYFPFERPNNIYQYEENLGSRLHFNQPLTMIAIDHQWLYKPLLDHSALLRKKYFDVCKAMVSGKADNTIGILHYIDIYLKKNAKATLNDCAEHLNTSPSTLKRKLKMHGTSFQQLQDLCKSHQAIFNLKFQQASNEVIASNLNFRDLTNFRRSFKRWTGLTPNEMRSS